MSTAAYKQAQTTWAKEYRAEQRRKKKNRNSPHYVYRQYDAGGRLLYVGCTRLPDQRKKAHASSSRWAREISRTTLEEFPNRKTALAAEAAAIASEHPIYNRQHRAQVDLTPDEVAAVVRAHRGHLYVTERDHHGRKFAWRCSCGYDPASDLRYYGPAESIPRARAAWKHHVRAAVRLACAEKAALA